MFYYRGAKSMEPYVGDILLRGAEGASIGR